MLADQRRGDGDPCVSGEFEHWVLELIMQTKVL